MCNGYEKRVLLYSKYFVLGIWGGICMFFHVRSMLVSESLNGMTIFKRKKQILLILQRELLVNFFLYHFLYAFPFFLFFCCANYVCCLLTVNWKWLILIFVMSITVCYQILFIDKTEKSYNLWQNYFLLINTYQAKGISPLVICQAVKFLSDSSPCC